MPRLDLDQPEAYASPPLVSPQVEWLGPHPLTR